MFKYASLSKLLNCIIYRSVFQSRSSSISSKMESQVTALLACGSFNPITNMHLRMFECARNYMNTNCPNINVQIGCISPVSDGYGKPGLRSSTHRMKMIELATANSTWIRLLDSEAKNPNWTPTKNVIKNTQETLQSESNVPIQVMLLCGGDLLESFSKKGLWKENDIFDICKNGIVVVCRPGFDSESYISKSPILSQLKSSIYVVHDIVTNDTNSTVIRKSLCQKQSVKYLIPDETLNYILENELYTEDLSEKTCELAPYAYNKS